MIRSASFTRISDFESCAYKAKLKYVDKVPEPPLTPPPGKLEHPMERGSRIHDESDQFIMGKNDRLPKEMREHFKEELELARDLYVKGKAQTEQLWAFTQEWEPLPLGRYGYWHIKIDLFFFITEGWMGTVDFKTGKRRWNEVKHAQQMILYLIAVFMRFQDVERATSELWYPDADGHIEKAEMTRRQAVALARSWNARAAKMTTATVFTPNPNKNTCRFCPYNQRGGTGVCDYAAL